MTAPYAVAQADHSRVAHAATESQQTRQACAAGERQALRRLSAGAVLPASPSKAPCAPGSPRACDQENLPGNLPAWSLPASPARQPPREAAKSHSAQGAPAGAASPGARAPTGLVSPISRAPVQCASASCTFRAPASPQALLRRACRDAATPPLRSSVTLVDLAAAPGSAPAAAGRRSHAEASPVSLRRAFAGGAAAAPASSKPYAARDFFLSRTDTCAAEAGVHAEGGAQSGGGDPGGSGKPALRDGNGVPRGVPARSVQAVRGPLVSTLPSLADLRVEDAELPAAQSAPSPALTPRLAGRRSPAVWPPPSWPVRPS